MKTKMTFLLCLNLVGCNAVSTGPITVNNPSSSVGSSSTDITPVPTPLQSTPTPPNSPEPTLFSGGTGSPESPYLLSTPQDILQIAQYNSAYFTLINDIDMQGVAFTPIESFSGVINVSRGYIIKNLVILVDSGPAAFIINLTGGLENMIFQNITVSSPTVGVVFAVNIYGDVSNGRIEGGTVTYPSAGPNINQDYNPCWQNYINGSSSSCSATVMFNGVSVGEFFYGN